MNAAARFSIPTALALIGLFLGLGFLLVLPAFLPGFFTGDDIVFHLNWSRHFAEQFWSGDLYPRWLAGMNGGRGSPVFFYYGPVPYYFTSLFQPWLWNDPLGWLRLGISLSLALGLSGITAFLWLEKVSAWKSAFVASIFYMLLPYHLVADLYLRFAFAEFWSFVWMPLTLYFTWKVVFRKRAAILSLALVYALLIMTHLPTALIFSLLPLAYSLVISSRGERLRSFFYVASGILLGVGLSAIYLVPALLNQHYVNLEWMTSGMFFYGKYFFKTGSIFSNQVLDPESEALFSMTISAAIICSLIFVVGIFEKFKKKEIYLWFWCSVLCIYMMFDYSNRIWEFVKIVQKIQFPFRFNAVLCLSTVALLAVFLFSPKKISKKFAIVEYLIVGGLLLSQVLFSALVVYTLAVGNKNISSQIQAEVVQRLDVSQGAFEYLPRWATKKDKDKFLQNKMDQISSRVAIERGTGTVKVISGSPRHLVLDTNGEGDLQVMIGQYFYPGWVATLLGEGRVLQLRPDGEGLLRLTVPKGSHQVAIDLAAGNAERMGGMVSLFCVTILIGAWAWLYLPVRGSRFKSSNT
jgi:6-pyruvoyl-tetrahydropterin synthase related domain